MSSQIDAAVVAVTRSRISSTRVLLGNPASVLLKTAVLVFALLEPILSLYNIVNIAEQSNCRADDCRSGQKSFSLAGSTSRSPPSWPLPPW